MRRLERRRVLVSCPCERASSTSQSKQPRLLNRESLRSIEGTPRTCAGPAHRQPLPIDLSTSKRLIELPTPDKLAPVADVLHTVFERDLRYKAVVERDEGPAAREGRMEVDVGPVGAGAVEEAWRASQGVVESRGMQYRRAQGQRTLVQRRMGELGSIRDELSENDSSAPPP